jgi:predicted transposase YbfD/YdcC
MFLFSELLSFNRYKPDSVDQVTEKGHGRIETRACEIISKLGFIDNRYHGEGLKTIVKITAHWDTRKKQETETCFYISSVLDDAVNFNSFIRQHWGIENKLHCTLDMVFDEDRQRKRAKNFAQNFPFIRKIALNLLKQDSSRSHWFQNVSRPLGMTSFCYIY